jgi:hypothetical protein
MKKFTTSLIAASFCSLFAVACHASSTPVTPSKEAVDACSVLKENDSCDFMKDNAKMTGTCQKGQDGKLSCVVKSDKPLM